MPKLHPDDLDQGDVNDLLARFRYKPNFSFETVPPVNEFAEACRLSITAWVQDSTRTPRFDVRYDEHRDLFANHRKTIRSMRTSVELDVIPITGIYSVPLNLGHVRGQKGFYMWLEYVLEAFEKHEFDEWFRVDGELVRDPHS